MACFGLSYGVGIPYPAAVAGLIVHGWKSAGSWHRLALIVFVPWLGHRHGGHGGGILSGLTVIVLR